MTTSPYTGATRADWETTADRLLGALAPYATPDHAQIRLHGRTSWSGEASDGLEGYARSFLLAAFRIAGARGLGTEALLDRYSRGLLAGTTPGGPFSWPPVADRSQQMVEAASIAIALHETRAWLWERLDGVEQDRVAAWLGGMVGRRTNDSNWVLFQVVVEQFLASVGAPYDQSEIDRGLDRIEAWHRGNGWYADGPGQSFDHYAAWAFQVYPLMWARMVGPHDGGRTDVYRERLLDFLGQYVHLFGGDGAPVHVGRSLTYRFAAVTPFWLGALCDATPLSLGQTRRLCSRTLHHFASRGVPDGRGLLTLGWYDEFLPMTQPYSGPASPYWASKGFLGLLLPPDHPVWTEPEAPLPIDIADVTVALPAPGWLVHATHGDGVVRLLNHGSDHNPPPPAPAEDDPHYAKLAYSSATAPDTGAEARAADVDGHVALVRADGSATRRRRIERGGVGEHWARSSYVDDGARLETTSVVRGPWEVRVHVVTGPACGQVRDGGFAVAGGAAPTTATGAGWATATTPDGLVSAIIAIAGWTEAGVAAAQDANAFGPSSRTPYLSSAERSAAATTHISLVVLSREPIDADLLRGAVSAEVAEHRLWVGFPDGVTIEVPR
ncbi:MAG: DUF2264 domain-containing protein [Nocardioidaceae bacterium]|nr:DUF2264 domain-containing protein [Nocardioidaceae bacterium]MCL2613596.1 DUF2264 domain-containing protein [Nocardioidaceae bacterium]